MKCRFNCNDGWYREPDGMGCVQWTLCENCNGERNVNNVDKRKTILANGSRCKKNSVCSTATKTNNRRLMCAGNKHSY